MNPDLKRKIDELLSDDRDASRQANNELNLQRKPQAFPPIEHLQSRIWQQYQDRNNRPWPSLQWLWKRHTLVPIFATLLVALVAAYLVRLSGNGLEQSLVTFNYAQSHPSRMTFGGKVDLLVRDAESFELRNKDNHFVVDTARISAFFNFEKKPGNSLVIRTPMGVFSVTGTRFLLKVREDSALLQVEEGQVWVERNTEQSAVNAGNQLIVERQSVRLLPLSTTDLQSLRRFQDMAITNREIDFGQRREKTEVPKKTRITIELFDGNRVSGSLVSESNDQFVVQSPNLKSVVVKKNEVKSMKRE